MFDLPAPLRPGTEKKRTQAGDQKCRGDQISQDAEVGVFVSLGEIYPHQQREGKQRADRQYPAKGADPIIEKRGRFSRWQWGGRRGGRNRLRHGRKWLINIRTRPLL